MVSGHSGTPDPTPEQEDAYEEVVIAKLDKEIARKARIAEIKAEIERLQAQLV